jgi:hypothetical protein
MSPAAAPDDDPAPVTGLGEWDDDPARAAGADRTVGSDDLDDAADDQEPELYYPDVATFVAQQLAPLWRRSLEGHHRTWCPQWWRHAEAISRLEALWRAWEHLRLDPATGMSVWFRDHADPHMAVLLDADGPFKGCSTDKGHTARLQPLPVDDPPSGLFTEPEINTS